MSTQSTIPEAMPRACEKQCGEHADGNARTLRTDVLTDVNSPEIEFSPNVSHAKSEPRSWRLDLPHQTLPLSLNDRRPWQVTARARRGIREDVRMLARHHRIPRLERIHVQLHHLPATNRTRDTDNAVATLKPCIDGLRDYPPRRSGGRLIDAGWTGIVADDDPEHVTWDRPVIHPPQPRPERPPWPARLWLIITEVPA